MVEQADASSEPDQTDNGAFSHGSLGRLAPTWWEPEEDEAEPEPWLAPTRRSTGSWNGWPCAA